MFADGLVTVLTYSARMTGLNLGEDKATATYKSPSPSRKDLRH